MMNTFNVVFVFLICIALSYKVGNANEASLLHRLKREMRVCKSQEDYPCIQNGFEQICSRDVYECCEGYVLKNYDCVKCSEVNECPAAQVTTTAKSKLSTNIITKCSPGRIWTHQPHRRGILHYSRTEACKWVIEGPPGSTIKINAKRLSLPERTMNFVCLWSWTCLVFVCQSASLRFSDNMRHASTPYCGQESIPDYISQGNRVTINFLNPANAKTVIDLSYEILGGREASMAVDIPTQQPTTTITTTTPRQTTTTTATTTTTTTTQIPATTTTTTAMVQHAICMGGMVWAVSRTNCRYMCNNKVPEKICSYYLMGGVRTPNTHEPGCECPPEKKYLKNDIVCVSREECTDETRRSRAEITTYSYPTPVTTTTKPRTTKYYTTETTTKVTTDGRQRLPFFFFTDPTTTAPQIFISQRTNQPESKTTTRFTTYPTTTLPPPSRVKCGIQKVHPVLKIYGGSTTAKGTWPWAVQVLKRKYSGTILVCGGTLICNQFVLTAAHCFLDRGYYSSDMSIYSLVIGKHANLFQRETDPGAYESINRFQFHPHPKYTFLPKNQYDIALLKLPKRAEISDTIRPACVPTDPVHSFSQGSAKPHDDCIAVGWGKTQERAYGSNTQLRSQALKQVILRILPKERCTYTFANYMPSHHLCAIGKTRQDDTCGGDSGGPLLCKRNNRWYIDGIVSYGLNCAEGDPGVYTRVGAYRKWIQDTIVKAGGDRNCIKLDTMYRSTTAYKK